MNQFFSAQRFALLVAKHWADNRKQYILSALAFIGLLITWFAFTLLIAEGFPLSREIQQITFFFSLFAIGSFFASQYFHDLGSKSKGINFLLVPASAFEKLLCSLLFTVVLFFAVFVGIFYLVDSLMVAIANALPVGDEGALKPTVVNVFKIVLLRFNNDTTINFLLFFFSVQSVFLLGSVYFEKFSFIKTVISGFLAVFFLFCLMLFFNGVLLPEGGYPHGFLTSYQIDGNGKDDLLVQVPRWIGELFRFIIMYATAPFFWLVTYFRLKEKQV